MTRIYRSSRQRCGREENDGPGRAGDARARAERAAEKKMTARVGQAMLELGLNERTGRWRRQGSASLF